MNLYFKIHQDLRKKDKAVRIGCTTYEGYKPIEMTRRSFEQVVLLFSDLLEQNVIISDEELPDDC
jgi:hypothetical protein